MATTIHGWHSAPLGYAREYWHYDGNELVSTRYALGQTDVYGDTIVALILDRETGNIVDYATTATSYDTGVTMAAWGEVVIADEYLDEPCDAVRALVRESKLRLDCFGGFAWDIPESL